MDPESYGVGLIIGAQVGALLGIVLAVSVVSFYLTCLGKQENGFLFAARIAYTFIFLAALGTLNIICNGNDITRDALVKGQSGVVATVGALILIAWTCHILGRAKPQTKQPLES